MISEEPLTVTLEEAIENNLLRSGNPAVADGDDPTGGEFWAQVESQVADEDYTPLLKLVAELRDKIIGLTPRRRDLAAETCEAMDVELLQQMMDYGAFDVVRLFFPKSSSLTTDSSGCFCCREAPQRCSVTNAPRCRSCQDVVGCWRCVV